MMVRVDGEALNQQAALVFAAVAAAGPLPPEEQVALRQVAERWQAALDALCGAARDLNSLEGLAPAGRRSRLAHLVNGEGFGGMY